MSKEGLVDLMNDLSEDPHLREKLAEDPDSVLEGRDLTAEETDMIKKGDAEGIRTHLGKEASPDFAKAVGGWIRPHSRP